METTPTIEQIVEQIRTAVYGKDVRENIALGIEKTYQDATDIVKESTQRALAEIEAKGEEVIESIPSDYSTLSSDVDNLKSVENQDQVAFDTIFRQVFANMTKHEILQNTIEDGRIITGTPTSGKAWNKNGNQATGGSYCYTRYEGQAVTNVIGNFITVSGWSWSVQYPLICFYDSNEELIASYGNQPSSTEHLYDFIPVPYGTSYFVVNGKTTTNEPVVAFISSTVMNRLLSNRVMPFYSTINAAYISAHSDFAYMRNWPNNTVYNIANDVAGVILDFPDGMSGDGPSTLVKACGTLSPAAKGYTIYILRDADNLWTGWDNGASIKWLNSTPSSININAGLENIDADSTTEGKAKHKNGSETSGASYVYSTFSVNAAIRTILVSGYHYANGYPLWIFYDSNNNFISSATLGNTGHVVYQMEVPVPDNAATVIVNGMRNKINGYINPSIEILTNNETVNDIYQRTKKRRYLFIGDSYCEGYSHDGSNSGWAVYCAEYMQLTTDDYVRNYKGGARFSANVSNNTYEALLDAAQYPFDYFTDIVVCGGYNDHAYTEENILAGIESFVALAAAKYPLAKVHIGFVAWNKAGNGTGAEPNWETYNAQLTGTTLPAYQKCVTLGVGYLNNVEYWINNSGITPSDGYHPSENGNRSIARAVANAILTGSAPLPYNSGLRLS